MKRNEVRKKLRNLPLKQDIVDLLEKVALSERERNVVVMFYVEKKQMMDIADELGVSEPTVLKDHARCLDKIGAIL